MDKTPEEHWREWSEQILTDITEWRRSHPKATFGEIEDEVHLRMSRLEAQLIQDPAHQSKSRAWSGTSRHERPRCPVCGRHEESDNASSKEQEDKKSHGTENREPAQTVGQVFFPLDEELALSPGSLTPTQQDHLAHLATWMPWERAREMLETGVGVQVSEPTVRGGTLGAGALYETHRTAHSPEPLPPSAP